MGQQQQTLINGLVSLLGWFSAKSPPVNRRNVHVVDDEGPGDPPRASVASFWKLDCIVELKRSVEICEFVIAVLNASLDDLLQPWLVSVEGTKGTGSLD